MRVYTSTRVSRKFAAIFEWSHRRFNSCPMKDQTAFSVLLTRLLCRRPLTHANHKQRTQHVHDVQCDGPSLMPTIQQRTQHAHDVPCDGLRSVRSSCLAKKRTDCAYDAAGNRRPTAVTLKQRTEVSKVKLGALKEIIAALCSASDPNAAIVVARWLLADGCVQEVVRTLQVRDTISFVRFARVSPSIVSAPNTRPQMTLTAL